MFWKIPWLSILMLIKFHDFSMTNKFSENSRYRDQIPWLSMTFQVACEPWIGSQNSQASVTNQVVKNLNVIAPKSSWLVRLFLRFWWNPFSFHVCEPCFVAIKCHHFKPYIFTQTIMYNHYNKFSTIDHTICLCALISYTYTWSNSGIQINGFCFPNRSRLFEQRNLIRCMYVFMCMYACMYSGTCMYLCTASKKNRCMFQHRCIHATDTCTDQLPMSSMLSFVLFTSNTWFCINTRFWKHLAFESFSSLNSKCNC